MEKISIFRGIPDKGEASVCAKALEEQDTVDQTTEALFELCEVEVLLG